MQSSKIDFLTKYNNLLKLALSKSQNFPDNLCDFLISEYEFQAVILLKVKENNSMVLLGKAGEAKKSYNKDSIYNCSTCKAVKERLGPTMFSTNVDCEILASEYIVYEGCLFIKLNGNEDALLKVAKKTPFINVDLDNLKLIGESIGNFLNLWMRNNGSSGASTSEIITDIAHELRTPTNSIMGFASLLNEDNLTSSQAEYVSTLKDNAFNLLSLINDLIDLAKIDSGQSKGTSSNIDLKNFIDEVINIFSDKITKNKVEFIVNIEKKLPPTVKLDAQKLRYILINILTNSLRLTERGKISLSISSSSNGKLDFRIADSSNGISSNKLKDIFKPFALTELSNNQVGSSSGLGLILTKKYIEFLKGEISVTSMIGKGTTYNFSIGIEPLSAIEKQIVSLPKSDKRNKVLVVEDDYATSKLLSNYLNKWGYVPSIVNSAEQAIKAIDKEIFLAVLMDIILPDTNGFDLLKRIREHKNAKNTPVIVCSVEAEQQKAFLLGAVEYFVKPIKYKNLVEVLMSYKLKKDSNILIVDDDVPTLNLIKETIDQAGYNSIAESHPAKVIKILDSLQLDIAIIDLDMPEINGFDLIKIIKSKPNFAKLPIVIYTGKENYKDDLKKIDGLFADLLEKRSTNIEELSDTITQMINSFDEPSTPEEVYKQKEGVKILLVEDYKHSQIIVTRLLKKNNFDSIVVVENGAEAVEAVKRQYFDLILMDMQMPVMNGFEATEKIRQLPNYKETPIIALTAFAMKGDREKCIEAGATDYIPKPIDSQEFIEKVKYYTENKIKVS